MNSNENKATLLLSDGTTFYGKPCGKIGTTTGEIAFNTGMTGYQEIFTDPSYYGQLLTMANSHIGNYGTNELEIESNNAQINGLIVKKFAHHFSRYGDQNQLLNNFLLKDNIVGIKDIDTRELIRHIRENGAQNAIISSDNKSIESLSLAKNALKSNPKYISKEYQTKQLWGKKLQKSAQLLFKNKEMKKVVREAKEKSQ